MFRFTIRELLLLTLVVALALGWWFDHRGHRLDNAYRAAMKAKLEELGYRVDPDAGGGAVWITGPTVKTRP